MSKYTEEELNRTLADTGELLGDTPVSEEFSLDDILAEFGTGASARPAAGEPEKAQPEAAKPAPEPPVEEPVPEEPPAEEPVEDEPAQDDPAEEPDAKERLVKAMEKGMEREKKGITDLPGFAYGLPDEAHTLEIMKAVPVLVAVLNTNGGTFYEEIGAEQRIVESCDSLSIGAAVENMLLRATELGVGSLWIANTCFAYNELVQEIGTKDQLTGVVALGYGDEAPAPRPRKDWNDVVEYRS